jgi:hypothetical protein
MALTRSTDPLVWVDCEVGPSIRRDFPAAHRAQRVLCAHHDMIGAPSPDNTKIGHLEDIWRSLYLVSHFAVPPYLTFTSL